MDRPMIHFKGSYFDTLLAGQNVAATGRRQREFLSFGQCARWWHLLLSMVAGPVSLVHRVGEPVALDQVLDTRRAIGRHRLASALHPRVDDGLSEICDMVAVVVSHEDS